MPPQTANGVNLNTDSIDMQKSHRAFFVLTFGATIGGTVVASLQESSDNSTWQGNGVAGAFTQSGAANVQQSLAPPTASSEYTFEVRADQLTPGKRYVRLNLTVTANNNLLSVVCYGDEGNHKPDQVNNAAAVLTQNVVT